MISVDDRNRPTGVPSQWAFVGRLLLALAALVLLALLWSQLCRVPAVPWNAARLAPSYALNAGLPIYPGPTEGAQLGWIYGPVFPELYRLPAHLSSLTWGFLAAGVLNLLLLLAPVVVLLRFQGAPMLRVGSLLVVYLLLLSSVAPSREILVYVHVDVPCVALGLMGCAWLSLHVSRGRGWSLHAAVLAFVVAAWTKQYAVFLVPGVLAWLWLERRPGLILRFLLWYALYGALFSAFVLSAHGVGGTVFQTVGFPSRVPAVDLTDWIVRLKALFIDSWLPGLLCLVLLPFASGRRPTEVSAGSDGLARLLCCVAASMVAMGLLALSKFGGNTNSLHSFYYLFVALLCLLARRGWESPLLQGWRICLVILVLGISLTQACLREKECHVGWLPWAGLDEEQVQAHANRGRACYPWNPILTIRSDHKIYPLDDALYCLYRAGIPVSIPAVRAVLPAEPLIIYHEDAQSRFLLEYFRPAKAQGGH